MWGSPGTVPKIYRLLVIGFGIISSPYQATWCLHETAKRFVDRYPKAANAILEDTYVDDNSGGHNVLSQAARLLRDTLKIMESGGFVGHKISANNPKILDGIDPDRIDPSKVVFVLGLKLDHETDEFMFDLDTKFESFDANAERITRRDVVSLASQVFDTQGFVSPYIMQYKKLLPMLWHNKTTWDENLIGKMAKDENGQMVEDPVAKEAVTRFKAWVEDIPKLKELRFPRHMDGDIDTIAIFGDASLTGIGAVAYMVKRKEDGTKSAHILYSKSTLMPKNLRDKALVKDALTIARAELLALVLCITMSGYIQDALKPSVSSKQVHIFTDSLLNLQHIQRGKGKCKPWEDRRVCKVLDNMGESSISFCPGVLNPADLPSRGCNLNELTDRITFWKEGPAFLLKPRAEWPKQPSVVEKPHEDGKESSGDMDEALSLYFTQLKCEEAELSEHQVMVAQAKTTDETIIGQLVKECSSLQKIRNIITRTKRLVRKLRGEPIPQQSITPEEVKTADLMLARFAQETHLSKEITVLREASEKNPLCKGNTMERVKLPPGSSLKNLPVFYDSEDKVIRLQSRMHTSTSLTFDFVNPIIMPKGVIAEKLALEIHHRRLHCSQKAVFNTLRHQFWFTGGFQYVKDLVRKLCKTPRCRYIKFCNPRMSPLPSIRLDNPEAWTNVGIDYAGPFACKHSCMEDSHSKKNCPHPKQSKVWIALFTCMHSRAIHVEVVRDCTTLEFLYAFRKFVARKGIPKTFYSDQAKTFKAADKQLRQLLGKGMNEIYECTYYTSCPVEWKFSTETAPWTNGCTERLVGLFKKQFQIVLRKHPQTLAQLEVITSEITASVNERPLGVVSGDPECPAITPNMLSTGRRHLPIQTPSSEVLSTMPCDRMWFERKKALATFWKQWQAEYLNTLSIDKKWIDGDNPVIKPGDVVILRPETLEKGQWRLARVTGIHKNLDGVVKTALVRLPTGTEFTRTLQQVALLEPAACELGSNKVVNEESRVISISCPEACWNGDRFDEGGRSREWPCLTPKADLALIRDPTQASGEQKALHKYPGEEGATSLNPEPIPMEDQPSHGSDEAVEPRTKRARKRIGFYRLLNDGCRSAE